MFTLDRRTVGFQSKIITDPDAGEEIYHFVSETTRILLVSVEFKLTTDSTVAERWVSIRGSDGTVAFNTSPAPAAQSEDEALTYKFASCVLGIDDTDNSATMWGCLASNLVLDPEQHLEINIFNLQVTDQISDIYLRFMQALPA